MANVNRFSTVPSGLVAAGLVGLIAFGVYACVHALGVLAGAFPVGKLPPYPAWTAVHFAGGLIFVILLPLQLLPGLRRNRPRIHRLVGRAAVACASAMAVSGLPIAYLAPERALAERVFMTSFFVIFGFTVYRGFSAALARDIPTHRAWMLRMTAVALTPLMQRLVFLPFAATLGIHSLAEFWEIFVSAAWMALAIQIAAVEWWLGRDRTKASLRTAAA